MSIKMIIFQLKWNSKFNSKVDRCLNPCPQTSSSPLYNYANHQFLSLYKKKKKKTTTHSQVEISLDFIHLLILCNLTNTWEHGLCFPPPSKMIIHGLHGKNSSMWCPNIIHLCPFDVAYKLLLSWAMAIVIFVIAVLGEDLSHHIQMDVTYFRRAGFFIPQFKPCPTFGACKIQGGKGCFV